MEDQLLPLPASSETVITALIKVLNETFPQEAPQRHETLEDLMWRGGQRSVVEWIIDHYDTDK